MAAMSLSAASRFFSLLALVALAGAVGIVVARFTRAGREVLAHLGAASRWLAFAVAGTAMVGSLVFSEHFGLEPCRMCWYQRIAMYSLAIILLVAAIRRDRGVRPYAIALAGVGLVISIYHSLLEWYPQLETSACDVRVPCSTPYFREFGFVTLAFMAGCGFLAVLALMLFTVEEDETDGTPQQVDVVEDP
jgi:disulfide bond formation protein DsbB